MRTERMLCWTTACALSAAGCASQPPPRDPAGGCSAPEVIATLDPALHETSGLAPSRRDPGLFWTVVDSDGDSAVFAVDTAGTLRQRVRVVNARNRDWEDVASGPCPGGAGDCLWIADTGDNREVYPEARLYVIPEPRPGDTVSAPARVHRAVYPEGPRDAEALFVTADGQPFVVTKGRAGRPVQLFLFPLGKDAAPLRPLQVLAPRVEVLDGITGAGSSRDGRWVALRSYNAFVLYRVRGRAGALRLEEVPGSRRPFEQPQGESVAFGTDGVYFTSEVLPSMRAPLARTRCPVTEGGASRADARSR